MPEWAKSFIPSCKVIYADGTYKKVINANSQFFKMSYKNHICAYSNKFSI